MIRLHPDFLLFQTASGDAIPCSAESVTVELIGDCASILDPQLIREAASAALHYFKHDLGRSVVSVTEFAQALARILTGLGFTVCSEDDDIIPDPAVERVDLRQLLADGPGSMELSFFATLRQQVCSRLQAAPEVLRFDGLRPCVKTLLGTKRWTSECEQLSDQIVAFLRDCFHSQGENATSRLIIL